MSTGSIPAKNAFRLFWSANGWFGLIFLLLGTGVLIGSGVVGVNAWRLTSEGEAVTGEVLGKDWRTSRDSDGDTSTSYYVRFSFDTRTGEYFEDENSVSYEIYSNAEIGDPIEVNFWPGDPMLNEIDPNSNIFIASLLGLLGLPFFLVGATFVTLHARFVLGAIKTRDRGEQVEAVVTEHQRSGLTVNNTRYYRLHWRDERDNTGKSRPAHPSKLVDYPQGSKISVYINPRSPQNGVWEGDVGRARSGYSNTHKGTPPDRSDKPDQPPTVRRN